jgi:iron complex transport system permease protein
MMVAATRRNVLLVTGALALGLAGVSFAALRFGSVPTSVVDVWAALSGATGGNEFAVIVREIRLPRVLLAILVGAALSTSGTALQAMLRNPLAEPYVLGISSGAALGAITALWIGGAVASASPLAAFLGALATTAWVFVLGRRAGRLASYTLVLAGVVTASFLSAVILFVLTLLSTRDVRGMAFWLMGDLSVVTGLELKILLPIVVFGFLGLYVYSKDLNVLLLGEEEAAHLGVNVGRTQTVIFLLASALTGVAVALAGAIGYLGLLVPHLARLIVGSDHRALLPAAALGGSIILVLSDTLARTLVAPNELPVGAVTAVAGAPVFIYLLRRTAG